MDDRFVETAWGHVWCIADAGGLWGLRLPQRGAANGSKPSAGRTPPGWFAEFEDQLRRYFDGEVVEFTIPLRLAGTTPFQERVLRACRTIPFGETLTYGELATLSGHRGAARAAGGVMARNPIPLVIPCHRVLASGGRIGGYSAPGGPTTKQRLLDHEAAAMRTAALSH